MSQKDQHQSAAMEAWQKTLPPACQNSTCEHDTVDHPGFDQCGGKMYCATCKRSLQGTGCYPCRLEAMGIKKENCDELLDEIIKLLKDKFLFDVCKRHDDKTPL